MERNFRQYLLAGTMLAGGAAFGGATPASAGPCPAVGHDTTGCAIIIDVTSVTGGVGTFTVSKGPNYGVPFDGSDDTLVGVTNTSGSTVNSINLSSKLDIFGFDGDGVEINPNPTSGLPGLGLNGNKTGPNGTGYVGTISTTGNYNLKGSFDTFSGITGANMKGTVNFPGGIANGGSAFFSLEEALTLSSITPPSVPEPTTLSILGAALAGFGMLRRRKKAT